MAFPLIVLFLAGCSRLLAVAGNFDAQTLFAPTEHVYYLEMFRCKREYALARLYSGVAYELPRKGVEYVSDRRMSVTLNKRYAASFQPDKVGVNSEQWWCIPNKRVCYEETAFSNWGATLNRGDSVSVLPESVFPQSHYTIAKLLGEKYRADCE